MVEILGNNHNWKRPEGLTETLPPEHLDSKINRIPSAFKKDPEELQRARENIGNLPDVAKNNVLNEEISKGVSQSDSREKRLRRQEIARKTKLLQRALLSVMVAFGIGSGAKSMGDRIQLSNEKETPKNEFIADPSGTNENVRDNLKKDNNFEGHDYVTIDGQEANENARENMESNNTDGANFIGE